MSPQADQQYLRTESPPLLGDLMRSRFELSSSDVGQEEVGLMRLAKIHQRLTAPSTVQMIHHINSSRGSIKTALAERRRALARVSI